MQIKLSTLSFPIFGKRNLFIRIIYDRPFLKYFLTLCPLLFHKKTKLILLVTTLVLVQTFLPHKTIISFGLKYLFDYQINHQFFQLQNHYILKVLSTNLV